jgi:hypothetical protein
MLYFYDEHPVVTSDQLSGKNEANHNLPSKYFIAAIGAVMPGSRRPGSY